MSTIYGASFYLPAKRKRKQSNKRFIVQWLEPYRSVKYNRVYKLKHHAEKLKDDLLQSGTATDCVVIETTA